MSKFLILVSTILLSQGVFASSDGVLAQFILRPGLMPQPQTQMITIHSNGDVTLRVEDNMGGEPLRPKKLARLSAEVVDVFEAAIDSWMVEAIVDLDEGKAPCMDAPSESWLVNKNGEEREIAARISCHDFAVSALTGGGDLDLLKDTLTNFYRLSLRLEKGE